MRGLLAVVAVLVGLIAVLALVVAASVLAPSARPYPTDGLTGIAWRWTATTTLGDPLPSVVPDSASYTVEFGLDGRFRATADCTGAAGSYRTIPPGRMGPNPGLVITPEPGATDACGAGSLAQSFVTDLGRAVGYVVGDGVLTLSLGDGTRMAFH